MTRPSRLPSPMPPLGDVLEFMRLLWAVGHGLQKTSKRMARQVGLTGPQRFALRLIGRFPGIAPTELAALLRLHPSTITGVIGRLERRQVIERRPSDRDGRRAHLFLTASGRRMIRSTTGTVEHAVRLVLPRVGRRHLTGTRVALARLADQLLNGPRPVR